MFITPEFGLFSAGSFPNAMGGWMQSVALGWIIVGLRGSAFWLGLLSLATMGPLLFAPIGGTIVDRVDRRVILLVVSTIQSVAAIALAVMALLGALGLPAILLLALLGGAPNAVGWPAWSAFIADLVPSQSLRQAVAVNSARFNLTRVVGPAAAGAILAAFGAPWCLVVAAVGTVCLAIALLFVFPKYKRPPQPPAPILRALVEAGSYAARERDIWSLLISAGALGLLVMPYTSFLPQFVTGSLHEGPEALGLLLTCGGVGAVAGAVLSGSRLATRRPRRAAAALHVAASVSAVLLALSPSLALAGAAAVVLGFASTAYLSVINATLQVSAPQGMLGRIMGIWVVVNAGSVPIGGVVLGAVAAGLALRPVEAIAGVMALVAVVALRMDEQRG